MRRLATLLFVFCLWSPTRATAIGDIALSGLAQQGKHHELIAALEADERGGEKPTSFRLMMLAGSYYEVGRYDRALATADRLEARIGAGDASAFGADLSLYPQIIRAGVSLDQGLTGDAIRHGRAALAALKPDQFFARSQLILTGGILGVAHALRGEASEARVMLDRIGAVSLAMSNLGPEKYTALARIHMALREFDQALRRITDPDAEVSAMLTMFYDPTFQNLPRHFIRTKSQFETGRIDDARRGYDALLAHPQIAQFGTLHWTVLHDRARLAIRDGDVQRAIELLRRAVEVIELRRASITTEAGRIGFVGDKQAVYASLIDALLREGQAGAALEVVERAKSRALVDMLAAQREFALPAEGSAQLQRMLAELDALDRAAGERRPAAGDADGATARNLGVVRAALRDVAPALAALVSVSAVPVAELAALLAPGEVLVEYYGAGPDLYAFVLRNGAVQAVRLDGAGLEEAIQAWRAALARAGDEAWQDGAAALHARWWQPLAALIGEARRVTVVPHGALHYLPFAALRGPDGELLVERHALRFLPSASVLRYLRPADARAAAPLLALGNPDLGDPRLDLKFAEAEARAVAALYPEARALLRSDASESNFRKAGGSFRILHVASHGSFRAESPLASGLQLARDADNDGLLTVGEMYAMRLNADLVTLSACETGLGKVTNGDDVVGLTRGFLYAGARAIVASLWSVDDAATARLMESFYRDLASTETLEALRQAQLTTRRSFPHPFYWAAFQLTGATR